MPRARPRACGFRAVSEAESIAAKGKAEAEAMHLKAEAWSEYTDAALAEMVIRSLPELARAVSEPLSKVDKIIMVGDGNGAPKLTGQVASVLAQLPPVVESLTGLKLQDLISRASRRRASSPCRQREKGKDHDSWPGMRANAGKRRLLVFHPRLFAFICG